MFNKRNESDEPRNEVPISVPPMSATQPRASKEAATIGPSIRINGDLSGEEDLIVQGHVEGTVTLKQNALRVGKEGHVSATVHARVIDVEGRVEGDVVGDEQVILHRSANVQGNISAPRVTLEDGCRFKGSIDMDSIDGQLAKSPKVTDFKPARSGDATRTSGSESSGG